MKGMSLVSEDGKKLTSLDYDVLKLLSSYVGKIDIGSLEYYKKDQIIRYRNRKFVYEFESGIRIYEYRRGYYYRLTEKDKLRNKKLVTRKRSKIISGREALLRAILYLIIAGSLFHNLKPKKESYKETLPIESTIEEETKKEVPLEVTNNLPTIEDNVSNIYDEVENVSIPEINTIDYRVEKRQETNEKLGSYIDFYATRYGMDASFMKALISQERHDEEKANPGQLTNSICGGNGFKAPVIKDNEVVGEDKVYIIGSFYNNYPVSDLNTMGHFSKFSESEQEEVRQAIRLQKEGYEIIKINDLKNGTSEEKIKTNIRISALYLSYLVNLKEDLFLGAVSYNAGPYKISSDLSYDELFNGIANEGDEFYLRHIAAYFTDDDFENGFSITLKDGKTIHYDIAHILKEGPKL